jgi:post-segregation antitoxin (ccd killing protein)
MTSELKWKVSVTLDADLVSEIEAEGENRSAHVNTALRNELGARRRHRGPEFHVHDPAAHRLVPWLLQR